MPARRPNILYIITDQQRYDYLGCTGHPALATPNIDRIAARGQVFDRYYCNNPICSPSRATAITGRYLGTNGLWDNGCRLPNSETTLPEVLAAAGYRTAAVGKLHLCPWNEAGAHTLESRDYWRTVKTDDAPEPYYGFQEAEVCLGHVDMRPDAGHYGRWLARHFPDATANLQSYLTPHPSGAREVSTWTLPPAAHVNSWIYERTAAHLEAAAGDDRPFFLHVGFPDPHHPFRAPEPWGSAYDPAAMPGPNSSLEALAAKPPEYLAYMHGTLNADALGGHGDFNTRDLTDLADAEVRQMQATTCGMIGFVDATVGRILDRLDELGLADDTVVVYTSDHGDLLGDHRMIRKGPFMLEGLLHVPFVIGGPGIAVGRNAALASHLDTMPTLLELAGATVPRGVQGRTFGPVLAGAATRHRDRVVAEFQHQFQLDRPLKTLITDDWKLTVWGGCEYGELYHLAADPGETVNLWDDPAAAPARRRLERALLHELVRDADILPWPPAVA